MQSLVLRNGGEAELERLLTLFHAAELQEERVRILQSLGAVGEEQLLRRVLTFAMSEHVRAQDTVFVLGGACRSVMGREMVWQFVKDNWAEFHQRYQGGFLLARLVKFSTEDFVSEEKVKDISDFFQAHPAPAAERTIQQSLENIRLNEAQLKRDSEAVKAYLASRS